jgi:transcription-repair coupling factor (superfamily II helicase)
MLDIIRSIPAYQQLLENICARNEISGLSLIRSARLPVLVALQEDLKQTLVFITDRTDHALTTLDELKFWSKQENQYYFPEPNPLFYEQAAWGTATRHDRVKTLTQLARYHLPTCGKPTIPPLVITTIRSVMAKTLPRRDFLKAVRLLKTGDEVAPEILQRSWVDIGYQHADTVLEPGTFSRRGGLLDIWPPAESHPLRLDFFGDEIESIRKFDPASQRTFGAVEQLLVTPAREILLGKATQLKLSIQEVDEFQIPVVHPMPASLLDYLPAQSLVFVDDLDILEETANEIEEQAVKMRSDSIREGTLSADFPVPYSSWSEIEDSLTGRQWVEFGYSASGEGSSDLAQVFTPGARFAGRLKPLIEHIAERCLNNERVEIVSRQVSRLKELWTEKETELDDKQQPSFHEGTLSEGWMLCVAEGCIVHLLTDSEIFGWERPKPRMQHRLLADAPESLYADLKIGDWVVHVDYGIGRFIGLVRRMLDGNDRDFFCVEYARGDQLFIPVHQADRLSRYIGSGEEPDATRLGTSEWSQAKEKVREAVKEVAAELLELYARRQSALGYAFAQDSAWQQELEASFPYVETQDQLKAIGEVKRDMEAPRPMDRLLCGDVGYGKTEVALRAAFKAVVGGKQVAILVPTTVLAQQHYETFCQRLAAYPLSVEMLSRFRSPREQDIILKNLQNGSVDIVIGTHRLIQPDVAFKDLGLVVIDEEQRFGVTHKEHLKKLRTEVDVLTLTATPIPRTLYMALTGVRDISTINTPPEERLPIITHIGPYSTRLIRQAILRELERGGQVFFVHNRVQTIDAMGRHVNNLVPEARIGIAHGQMPEHELAAVMRRFTAAEIDILLCTSIIESGLDIPNANTLIVDRGDMFGLAQLYQLRGRVGRGAQRAYAYFFRHKRKPPTLDGQERLEVIAENSQLGAGYSIAMRDLEMRGAGEMLGTRQHGYIQTVGFHLYTRLLAQAVRNLRQAHGLEDQNEGTSSLEIQMPVTVDLPFEVGIPSGYVPDLNMRLRLYRRLADLQNEEEITAMQEEFKDRFGHLPEQVKNLFYQIRLKLLAEKAGLASITVEADQMVLRYPPLPEGVPSRNLPLIGYQARSGKNAYWMPLVSSEGEWNERLYSVVSAIISA